MNPTNNNNVYQSPQEAQRSIGGNMVPASIAISIDAIAKRVEAYIAEGQARRANKAKDNSWQ